MRTVRAPSSQGISPLQHHNFPITRVPTLTLPDDAIGRSAALEPTPGRVWFCKDARIMADFLAAQSQRLRLHRLSAVGQRLLHRSAADRSVTVRRNDVFLVSYPRSGNTWLRFIISNLVEPLAPVDFITLEHRAPDIHINSDRAMQRLRDPRFLKSHEYFDPRYRRVLYVVRDPRDIVPSYYRYHVNYGTSFGWLFWITLFRPTFSMVN